MSNKHFYDRCDGGICLKCDKCQREGCCSQTEVCDGQNWSFMHTPIFICPNRFDSKDIGHPINHQRTVEHQVKWNNGAPFCLGCGAKAVFAIAQKDENEKA